MDHPDIVPKQGRLDRWYCELRVLNCMILKEKSTQNIDSPAICWDFLNTINFDANLKMALFLPLIIP